MKFSEKTIKSQQIFDGKVFSVKKDIVKLVDDSEAIREVVVHNGGAGILAINEDKKVILVRQFRKGAEEETLEIPAGKLEVGEEPTECVKRELLEETGYFAKKIKSIGQFYPTPAYCTEKIHLFMATQIEKQNQKLDDGEFLEIVELDFDKAYNMVLSNEIKDAKTIIAILIAKNIVW